MSRYTITMFALLVIPSWHSAADDQVYAFKGEQYPKNPFVLTASISRDAAQIGDTLKVTYRLSNTSDVAISTCASGWDEYSIVGADGNSRGLVHVHKDGISSFNFLRLPPGTTLSWESQCEVLEVAPGEGSFIALFRASSMCSYLWQGEVGSTPIPIQILPLEQ